MVTYEIMNNEMKTRGLLISLLPLWDSKKGEKLKTL